MTFDVGRPPTDHALARLRANTLRPSESIGRLFKPFTQVDGAYAKKHEGVGLGLSICKSIVEAYGGTIGIDSAFGVGTTVVGHFPPRRSGPDPERESYAIAA